MNPIRECLTNGINCSRTNSYSSSDVLPKNVLVQSSTQKRGRNVHKIQSVDLDVSTVRRPLTLAAQPLRFRRPEQGVPFEMQAVE